MSKEQRFHAPLRNLDQALQEPIDTLRDVTSAARASLFLRDPATGEAVTRVAHLPEIREIRLPPGEGIVGAVFDQGRALSWPGDAPPPSQKIAERTGYAPRTILAFPVRLGGRVVGVVQVMDARLDAHTRLETARAAHTLEGILANSTLAPQLLPRLARPSRLAYQFDGMVGACPEMIQAFTQAQRAAAVETPMLLMGEKGTGKELLARTIHANSHRASAPFVKAECNSLPDLLLTTELFGYEQEAFNRGQGFVPGRIQQAQGGTLFLEEVGSLPAGARETLQRVLAEEVVVSVGSKTPQPVNVRVIAATSKVLDELSGAGLFLFLGGISIRLPPLRERGQDDMARLLAHLVDLHGQRYGKTIRVVPSATQELLATHGWPRNLDELSEAVEEAVLSSDDGVLRPDRFQPGRQPVDPFADRPTLGELESRYIRYLMDKLDGRRTEVASALGMGRTTLWRKLQDLGFEKD